MNPTDSHPEQVRALLAEAAEVVTSPGERLRVETLHTDAMGIIEGEHEAQERAMSQWLEDQSVMADIGLTVPVPARDDDEVEV